MRKGRNVDIENPIYLLDKNRGFLVISTVNGEKVEIRSLKFKNREAYDNNYFEMKFGNKEIRLQKDELWEALRYV